MVITPDRLLELGTTYFEMFNSRDWPALRERYADEAVMVSPNPPSVSADMPNRLEGPDAIIAFFDQATSLNEQTFEVLEHFVGVDLVTTTWRWGSAVGQDIMRYGSDELIIEQFDVTPKRSTLHR